MPSPLSERANTAATTQKSAVAWTPRLEKLIVASLLILCMLDLPNYLGEIAPSLQPKLLYFPMMLAGLTVLMMSSSLALPRVRPLILAFVVVYSLVNIGHATLYRVDTAGESAHIAWSRIQFLLLAFFVALSTTAVRRLDLARIFCLCSIMIAVSLLVDFALPYTLYPPTTPGAVLGRFGSFFINPNKAGEAVVLTAMLGLPAISRRTALPFLALVCAAVLVTFSRSAMVAMVLLTGLAWASGLLGRTQLLLAGAALLLLVASGGVLSVLLNTDALPSIDADDIVQRLQFLSTGDLHDDSAQERAFVVMQGLQLFFDHPLMGAGSGATHLWQFEVAPHNQAVMMAAEYGLLGLAGWLVLLYLIATGSYFTSRGQQLGAAALMLFFSMSTHNMLDFPYWSVAMLVLSMRYAGGSADGAGKLSTRVALPSARQPVGSGPHTA